MTATPHLSTIRTPTGIRTATGIRGATADRA